MSASWVDECRPECAKTLEGSRFQAIIVMRHGIAPCVSSCLSVVAVEVLQLYPSAGSVHTCDTRNLDIH